MTLFDKKKFVLTNSQSGKREEFKPQKSPSVTFYSCGPTVYGPLHIGNARALITADLLYRWLNHIGYQTNFVRNYTDVDDKIIHRSLEEKISSLEVANKYIEYCEYDMKLLGLKPPVKTIRVTESMDDIFSLIKKIIDRKHAYVVPTNENGFEVFFSIDSFKTYGKLSGRNVEELQAGARIDIDENKKNPLDFSLWKPAKKNEPFWESPWGKGRPGWHIECSAMAGKWLGETIDLHHGGQDLIFPHHENEIAQSESANGKIFCRHWVHNAFVTMGKDKMSKSLGNIITIRKFIEDYGAEVMKYMYFSHHYRSSVEMTVGLLLKVCDELERIYTLKKWAGDTMSLNVSTEKTNDAYEILVGKAASVWEQMETEMFSDLNSPGALGHLFTFIRDLNRTETIATSKSGNGTAQTAARKTVAQEVYELLQDKLFSISALFAEYPDSMLLHINQLRGKISSSSNAAKYTDDEIKKLIMERKSARDTKNFARADEIRKELDSNGILLVDSPSGTVWKFK